MMKLSNICKSIAAVFVAASASLAVEVWDGSVAESFAEGKGTVAEPYKISNGAELALFAQRVSVKGDTTLNAVLTNDIYLNENSEEYEKWGETPPVNKWVMPIGLYAKYQYHGRFEGNGHKVYGMFFDSTLSNGLNGVGFFGTLGDSAIVRNFGVEQSYFGMKGSIDGTVVSVNPHVGVIAGIVNSAHVSNVTSNGVVRVLVDNSSTAARYSENGCVVGYAAKRAIFVNVSANCVVESALNATSTGGTYHSIGGFAGKLEGTTFAENIYSRSVVRNLSKKNATGEYAGGIVGHLAKSTDSLYNAYYNVSTIGTENAPTTAVGNSLGVVRNVSSRTTSKMKSEEFAALLGPAFTYTASKNDGYPFPVVFEGAAAFDGGDGSETSPYLIGSAKALRAVSGLVNGMNAEFGGKSYKMTADVELNEDSETYKSWETTPPEFSWFQIGREYHRKDTVSVDCAVYDPTACTKNIFSGTFDGDHHNIKGLFLNDTTNQSQGGLIYAAKNAVVKNLGIDQSFISVKGRGGAIVGVATSMVIDSCHNSAEIRSISQDNGGIAGAVSNTKISNTYNTGNVKIIKKNRTVHSSGGIVGEAFRESEISYCWNSGNVNGYASSAGGIVAYADSSKIFNVYNFGNISSDSLVGGVVGRILYSGSLSGAYSYGAVSATGRAATRGGVVGFTGERTSPKVRNTISDSYYNSQTIGSTNAPTAAIGTVAGTVTNVSALPTASMTTGRFAVMLGSAYKQDDNVNNGYPTFLAAGESFGVLDLFEGGDGSEGNPFLIATATQLRNMEYLVNKKNAEYGNKRYKLVADIVLNDNTSNYATWATTAPANVWTPMGVDTTVSFKGVFDGGNYTISGLYTNAKFSGLFGVVFSPAVVKNVIIKESLFKTTDRSGRVGSFVGYSKGGELENLHNMADVYALHAANVGYDTLNATGGIVGRVITGSIKNVSNGGRVKALATAIKAKMTASLADASSVPVAGIVGGCICCEISDAVNTGSVYARVVSMDTIFSKPNVGGIAGNLESGIIRNSRNEGSLEILGQDSSKAARSWTRMGGIVGSMSSLKDSSFIIQTENHGSLTGKMHSSFDGGNGISIGGIVGRFNEGVGNYIRHSANYGNISSISENSNVGHYVGGIGGYSANVKQFIENVFATGTYTVQTTATAGSKKASVVVGGIAVNLYGGTGSEVRGSYFYGKVVNTINATTKTSYVGGIVGNSSCSIIGSYFDSEVAGITAVTGNNTGTLTKSKALTTAEMQTNEFAWLLNTLGGDSTNSNVFSRYNSYPEFADESNLPIYRVVFDDEVDIKNLYTSYKGYISAPADPEPAPGEMFVGWTDGDRYMLQNRQVINKDMTLYALFTLLTKPIYKITFMDGDEVLVKVTENDGKIANFPVAKNIPMGYHFDGWYDNATNKAVDEEVAFTGTATLIAKFSANLYKVTFLDYDGSEISSDDVAYGTTPKAPKVTRESTDEYSYTLKGWTPDIDVVVGDASYTAVYDSTKIESSSSEEQSSSSSSSIEESSSSSEEESSSSEEVSSSSEEDSSSSVEGSNSSSSSAKSSSSSAKSSSSSAKSSSSSAKSSSSSAKSSSSSAKSSSSKGDDKDAIYTIAQVPQFNISVAGRTLQIAGAQANSKVAVFDLRGNVMYAGFAYATNFSIEMPRSGSYLVRIGNQTQRVNVK